MQRRRQDRCSEFEEYRKNNLREGKPSHPKMYNRQVKNVRRSISNFSIDVKTFSWPSHILESG
ncbi:hypothetical protein Avbf_17396 [Armadillidium vulgare]|nr:hypothetical protein Avbf_17396 [Armadillidium vulgare]